jgi:hypothetical protein
MVESGQGVSILRKKEYISPENASKLERQKAAFWDSLVIQGGKRRKLDEKQEWKFYLCAKSPGCRIGAHIRTCFPRKILIQGA